MSILEPVQGVSNGSSKPAQADPSQRAFAVNGHEASDVCLVPTIGGAAMKFPTAVESDDAAGAGYHTIQEKAGIATNGIAYTELPTKRLDDFREKEQVSTNTTCFDSVPC